MAPKKLKINGNRYICTTCYGYLSSKKDVSKGGCLKDVSEGKFDQLRGTESHMPPLCYQNNLQLAYVPPCLERIGDVGNQLLAKDLIFIKLRNTRSFPPMDLFYDRVVS